ncbi:hypothetical protein [Actinomadura sp. 3N508]|uniref:hypothetical protein n=1 Tax=Actinomadura sp. 3N508 TaxID=3375153 RepID=UPI00378D765E
MGAIGAALVVIAGLATALAPPKAEAFRTYYWFSESHAEHEKVTRAALACKDGQTPKSTNYECFESWSITQIAGSRGFFGGVGRPDRPNFLTGSELENPAAHCDNADYLQPEHNGDKPYPRTRAQASEELLKCIRHLRDRFDSAAKQAGNGILHADGEISYSQTAGSCEDNVRPGDQRYAKCRVADLFGRLLHGVQDFASHSNWADQSKIGEPFSRNNPPGMLRTGVSPLLGMRWAEPDPRDIPESLTTGCYPSDECEGRVRHDEDLNKDSAIIDANGKVTLDNPTPRGKIGDNEQLAVTSAINDTRRQWSDLRAEIKERYGDERGDRIICSLTYDRPTGFWWWEEGPCDP